MFIGKQQHFKALGGLFLKIFAKNRFYSYENQPRMGIFTRFWPNFGFESHKIARYLVLNVSMAHSDALRQCTMP